MATVDRAEARRAARLLGWRGTKAKRTKRPDPAVAAAVREAMRERMERESEPKE